MPSISEQEKFGKVAKWKKQEGDKVKTGDQLCEIEFTNFSINLNMEEDSYVAQIMVPAGDGEVPVGSPLCALVEKQEDIGPFRAAHAPQANKKDFGFTQKDIMTTINHMLKAAQIDEELAGQLLSLARHENLELYEAFNGSFEGKEFSEQGLEGLDTSFFLLQAKDIVKTTLAPAQQESKPAAEQNKPAPEQSKPAAEP
ncbi:hypothetical protein JKP88DRAFT_283569 [Tribonema minus]|uniref:Lipoyl-binding domain-containing protein n=1 Tax=Tribonema minus TaxID=303371 RepID=A0A835YHE8_9STRA|nr:hypothetical protein JKP88DRAFT_283569 [Tribonema minus]